MDYNDDPSFFNPVPQHKSQASFFADANFQPQQQQQQPPPPQQQQQSFPQQQAQQQQEMSSSIYLLKRKPPPDPVTGSMNLFVKHGLESTHNKFCVKKLKESLSSYLSSVPSVQDDPSTSMSSSLTMLIKEPPITANQIRPLETSSMMSAFRLHATGPLPEKYLPDIQRVESKKKHKHKSKSRLDALASDMKMDMKEQKKLSKRKHESDEKKKKKKEKRRKKEKDRP